MSRFQSAGEVSARFYADVVRPLLGGRRHAAGLLGWGSDVLGYDTERSTDHGWGPRLVVFLEDAAGITEVARLLDAGLPERFEGRPVRYGWDATPVQHHVTMTTLPRWLAEFLGVDASAGMSVLDWLLTPQQLLLGVTGGEVYADDGGALGRLRRDLRWYPDPVWRWLLACQWHRVAQEEAFVARTAEVGDDTGSAVTAARLVRDLMRLALLLDRRYAPYPKWLGTAFARAAHPDGLPGHLAAALRATDGHQREAALAEAFLALADRHNAAALTAPLDTSLRNYHARPAQVLMADRFSAVLTDTFDDSWLRRLPLVGAVDQFVDSADVLSVPSRFRTLAAVYGPAEGLSGG